MDVEQGFLQRYGGHMALFVIMALLFIGGRATVASGYLDYEVALESGVEATEAVDASIEPTPTVDPVQTPVPTIDQATFPTLIDNSVVAALNPQTFVGDLPAVELGNYVVERNDTPNGIALHFDILPETLLGCNPELGVESSLLHVGVELVICPGDGLLHTVRKGETVEGIAAKYDVDPAVIIAYEQNRLSFPFRLYEDTQLFVPGAVRELFVWSPPALPLGPGGSNSPEVGGGVTPLVVGTGFFIWPVSNFNNITQYYWYGHQGLDIALLEGSPVFASDTGTVTYAGWSVYCYGNLVVINHGNGYETFYAHLNSIYVGVGQAVQKGATIGTVGNTGCSSGPHLHFEIRENTFRHNPLGGFLP